MRKHAVFLLTFCLLYTASGCAVQYSDLSEYTAAASAAYSSAYTAYTTSSKRTTVLSTHDTQTTTLPATTAAPSHMDDTPARWCYALLDEDERAVYDQMYAAAEAMEDTLTGLKLNRSAASRVFDALRLDCPELFWLDGHSETVTHSLDGAFLSLDFRFFYTFTPDELSSARKAFEHAVDTLDIPDGSDYDKALAIHDLLIGHVTYRVREGDQSLYTALVEGEGVCRAYAAAAQYLLRREGIPCLLITGRATDSDGVTGPHAWNLVYLDDDWYGMDVTWDDADDGVPGYAYFLVTSGELERSREADIWPEPPVCTATEGSYFVREGALFNVYDEAVGAYITRSVRENRPAVSLKFTSRQALIDAKSALLDGQEVYTFLRDAGNHAIDTSCITHSTDSRMLVLTLMFTY
ncbi:MAG: hypothetical protein GX929_09245 [Clostridiales bacterium]|nr:hypothetical protein [Clostridiales bacterium]